LLLYSRHPIFSSEFQTRDEGKKEKVERYADAGSSASAKTVADYEADLFFASHSLDGNIERTCFHSKFFVCHWLCQCFQRTLVMTVF